MKRFWNICMRLVPDDIDTYSKVLNMIAHGEIIVFLITEIWVSFPTWIALYWPNYKVEISNLIGCNYWNIFTWANQYTITCFKDFIFTIVHLPYASKQEIYWNTFILTQSIDKLFAISQNLIVLPSDLKC